MSREVTEGWKSFRVGDVAEIKTGGTPSRTEERYWSGDIPWMASGEIHQRYVSETAEKITELALKESNARILPAGSVMIALNGQGKTRGKAAILRKAMACNQSLAAIIPNASHMPEFFLFLFESMYSQLRNLTGDDARNGLNLAILKALEVALPPLHEQRRIAEILSSVDEAIAATRAVIEQTRKVKQSSLGALFHRGNWADTELPAGHHITSLEGIARRGSGHTPSKKFSEYWNGGVAWVSLQDTKALDRRHINNTAANISDLGVKNSSAEVHPAGTVFVSRDATVGRVGIMQTPMAVSQHFIAWTCGPMLDNLFLYYWLLNMKPVFERIAAGSTIKTIGLGFFKELQIALPDIATQKRIASQMMAIDDALDENEASLDELKAVKSALMSDLLNGRKRVTSTLPMAAE